MITLAAFALTASALAEESPVTVSPNAIGGTPKIEMRSMSGGNVWQLKWRKDDKERLLVLSLIIANAGKRATIKRDEQGIYDMVFKEGLTTDKAEADVRKEGSGDLSIWGGDAEWLLGSELAERNPMDLPLGDLSNMSNKAPRGPERNYCVMFTWLADNESRGMAGTYCTVVPAGDQADAETMLKALGLSFN